MALVSDSAIVRTGIRAVLTSALTMRPTGLLLLGRVAARLDAKERASAPLSPSRSAARVSTDE
jgi:hypothetical protein